VLGCSDQHQQTRQWTVNNAAYGKIRIAGFTVAAHATYHAEDDDTAGELATRKNYRLDMGMERTTR